MDEVSRGAPAFRPSRRLWIGAIAVVLLWAAYSWVGLPPLRITFLQSSQEVDAYDFIEITADVGAPRAPNPFTNAALTGTFRNSLGGDKNWKVEGFCDADDGRVFRLRFMPAQPGEYSYSVAYRQGLWTRHVSGRFSARASQRRGPVRIDPDNRWHFIWEGTAEHYFLHGTTAYWLLGWKDDGVIESAIERLHRLKVNRLRVTVAGRTNKYFGEPVMAGENWTPYIRPWQSALSGRFLHRLGNLGQSLNARGFGIGRRIFAELAELGQPDDLYHPNFDYSRFELPYWRKFERALRFARDRDMIVSLVLDMNDAGVHPLARSDDERRFLRYAVARFGAFSNITWDLGDDLNGYRDDRWTHETGTMLQQWDPYQHLATSHPMDNAHQDRTSDWFGFTSFQEWSRHQHAFMLEQRKKQAHTGRIVPQVNEEYGYEDHYPVRRTGPQSDSADALRRSAWEIVMAGGYQTTGETARRGTNILPDTGGGWMNGRGDETMTMLVGYAHMVDFFTSFAWWQTEPHDELVSSGNYCLAKPGELYAVYAPRGGEVAVSLRAGLYQIDIWNAVTGEQTHLPALRVSESSWRSPALAAGSDWAMLLRRRPE